MSWATRSQSSRPLGASRNVKYGARVVFDLPEEPHAAYHWGLAGNLLSEPAAHISFVAEIATQFPLLSSLCRPCAYYPRMSGCKGPSASRPLLRL